MNTDERRAALRAAKAAENARMNAINGAVRLEAQRAGFRDPAGACLEGDFSTVTTDDDGQVDMAELRRRLADLATYRPELTDGRPVDPTWVRSSDNTGPDMRKPWDEATVTDLDKLFYGTT